MGALFMEKLRISAMIRRLNGISAILAFLAVSTLAEAQDGKLFQTGIGGSYYPVG